MKMKTTTAFCKRKPENLSKTTVENFSKTIRNISPLNNNKMGYVKQKTNEWKNKNSEFKTRIRNAARSIKPRMMSTSPSRKIDMKKNMVNQNDDTAIKSRKVKDDYGSPSIEIDKFGKIRHKSIRIKRLSRSLDTTVGSKRMIRSNDDQTKFSQKTKSNLFKINTNLSSESIDLAKKYSDKQLSNKDDYNLICKTTDGTLMVNEDVFNLKRRLNNNRLNVGKTPKK